jgi:hypothetical protein
MVQHGKRVQMIGVSLSHGQDPWTSKQKTVHLSLHKVALHLHVGPQQQQAPGLHIEQRSKQHVTSAQQTIISPRHPILGGRTIAALQQQQPETSVSMLQHPILINRPIVVTAKGVKLCRPSELVLSLLDNPNIGHFVKEDGEVVIP